MEENEYWEAVRSRNRAFDGVFVYAVRSTGIYCRPSPLRRPRPNTYSSSARQPGPSRPATAPAAVASRTSERPMSPTWRSYSASAAICPSRAIDPATGGVGAGVPPEPVPSPAHVQTDRGGYATAIRGGQRLERFKTGLKQGESVTDALYEAGYPSNSSAYTQAARQFGMTPATYCGGGAAAISYTVTESPLGWLLVAGTTKGLCPVRLGDSPAALEAELASEFPHAGVTREDTGLGAPVTALMGYLAGTQPHLHLPLDVRATAFQQQVWRAVQAIPLGSTRPTGRSPQPSPAPARAVACGCATNPVALVIPAIG